LEWVKDGRYFIGLGKKNSCTCWKALETNENTVNGFNKNGKYILE